MPELNDEQFEALKNLLQRVSHLEEEVIPQLGVQITSMNELISNLNQKLHSLESHQQQQFSDLGSEIHAYMEDNFVPKSTQLVQNNQPIRVKAPAHFTGQANYIDSFFTQLKVVFLSDPVRYEYNDINKILYTINCLSGNALNFILPFIKDVDPRNKPDILTKFDLFKQTLYDAFADSNPVFNAETAIRKLKQSSSATDYATEFRTISMKLTWNNAALVSQYLLNLKDVIKDELARREPIPDLNTLIAATIDIDNRLSARNQQRSNTQKSLPVRFSHKPEVSPMEINSINSNKHNSIIRGPLTNEEKERRKKLNLCLYCGNSGHFSSSCSFKRSTNNRNQISTILFHDEDTGANSHPNYSVNAITRVIPKEHINLVTSVKKPKKQIKSIFQATVKKHQKSIEKCMKNDINYVVDSQEQGLIVIPITLQSENSQINTLAMIDSGSSGCFILSTLVRQYNFPETETEMATFRLANSSEHTTSGASTLLMNITDTVHSELLTFRHLDSCAYPVILGQNWLQRHNPAFNWSEGFLALTCLFRNCQHNCPPGMSHDDSDEELHPYTPATISLDHSMKDSFLVNSPQPIIPEIKDLNLNGDNYLTVSNSINPDNQVIQVNPTTCSVTNPDNQVIQVNSTTCSVTNPDNQVNQVNSTTCSATNSANQVTQVNPTTCSVINPANQVNSTTCSETLSVNHDLQDPPFKLEKPAPTVPNIPIKYQDFASIFCKIEADRLPPHRPYDHTIPLKPDSEVTFGPLYNLSKLELDTLYAYLQENLAKGFIERSESSTSSPVLFVKKKDSSLRLVVDYRKLNQLTIPNRCPLPLISETLDRLHSGNIFTKLDMRGAYNLLRIAPGHEWKTAFRTRYGLFQYKVMPFGLCNAPASFQAFVNDTLRDYLDSFVVVYLDDILIYSINPEEHTAHVRLVLQKLTDARLSLKLEKCEFDVTSVQFLGFVINSSNISMDPEKVEAIRNWKDLSSIHDVQVFLGLTNFYKRFIANYSKICVPLTVLLKKDVPFTWNTQAIDAFNHLKDAMTKNPVLQHFNPKLPCIIETDASDFALGAVCSQQAPDGLNHPIAFFSRKLLPAELNYQIYDKELLAIVAAFKHWRHYLEFSEDCTVVLTDHKNLEYFATTRNLSRRQVRWAEILGDFNYRILYRAAKHNAAADSLSRKDRPLEGDSPRGKVPMTLINPQLFLNSLTSVPLNITDNHIANDIVKGLSNDSYFGPIILDIQENPEAYPKYSYTEKLLFHQGQICVPDLDNTKRAILQECHDSPAAGHFGISKTYDMVSRNYYWPGMRKYIKDYTSGCDTCIRNKNSHHKPYGLLQSLPVPESPWSSISVDFITQLPPSGSYSAICVFVDRFSKMALFIPTTNQVTAEDTSQLFLTHVFCHFGLPDDIVSDRGATFTSKFTQALLTGLKVKQNLSTAFHPQTDGQTERVNSVLEQYLRCYINYQQSNWSELLPIAQFAYNNSKHSSTDTTPFYAVYGYHPRLSVSLPRTNKTQTPAEQRLQHIHDLHEELKFNISIAQEKHAYFYNKRVNPGPKFKVGDKVWLSSKNIKSQRPTGKLDYKKLGPFKIIAAIGSRSYKLELPRTMHIHPVFHMNLLEPYQEDKIKNRPLQELPPIIVNAHQEYEVEQIIDSRIHRNTLQYLVHWKGYTTMDRTWEPIKNLTNCTKLLDTFHQEYPTRPSAVSLQST